MARAEAAWVMAVGVAAETEEAKRVGALVARVGMAEPEEMREAVVSRVVETAQVGEEMVAVAQTVAGRVVGWAGEAVGGKAAAERVARAVGTVAVEVMAVVVVVVVATATEALARGAEGAMALEMEAEATSVA